MTLIDKNRLPLWYTLLATFCLLPALCSLPALAQAPADADQPKDDTVPETTLIIERQQLMLSGSPSLSRLVAELPAALASDWQSEPYLSQGLEGTLNLSLHGLGPARTLVLLDGQRMGFSPLPLADTGETFVDSNPIPFIALQRLQVQTTGGIGSPPAADAMTGTLNWQTRRAGVVREAAYSNRRIDGSAGDESFGALWGWGDDRKGALLALQITADNSLPRSARNWSDAPALPACLLTDTLQIATDCAPTSTAFVNLVNPSQSFKFYGRYETQLDTGAELDLSALWAQTKITAPVAGHWAFRSAANSDPAADSPAYVDLLARNGGDIAEAPLGENLLAPTGMTGTSKRRQQTRRLAFNRRSEPQKKHDGFQYSFQGAFQLSDAWISDPQVDNDRLQLALIGYGGADCDVRQAISGGATAPQPGQGDCAYYNPYLTGWSQLPGYSGQNPLLATNPATDAPYTADEIAALSNSDALMDWLVSEQSDHYQSKLSELRLVYDGIAGKLAGGDLTWQAGASWQHTSWRFTPDRGATKGSRRSQRGVFSSWYLPFAANLDAQLSLHMQDYGQPWSDVSLPALALRWHSGPWAVQLAQASTARAPSLSQIAGSAPLSKAVAGGYAQVQLTGNANLLLEEADRSSLTASVSSKTLALKLSLWQLSLSNPIALPDLPELQPGDSHSTSYANLGDLNAEGTDLTMRLYFPFGDDIKGELGLDLVQIGPYEIAAQAGNSGNAGNAGVADAAGGSNSDNFLRPLPSDSLGAYLNIAVNRHNLRLQQLSRSGLTATETSAQTDDWQVWNLHYFYRYRDQSTSLYLSALNIGDEPPPTYASPAGYDAYHHSPVGQVIKIGVHHNFQ